MKRQFVIECDTEYQMIFVHEATKEFTADAGDHAVIYYRNVDKPIFSDFIGPRFYGQLDTILFSQERLDNAPPIEIELPEQGDNACPLDVSTDNKA
jgi:hypothetical protein